MDIALSDWLKCRPQPCAWTNSFVPYFFCESVLWIFNCALHFGLPHHQRGCIRIFLSLFGSKDETRWLRLAQADTFGCTEDRNTHRGCHQFHFVLLDLNGYRPVQKFDR